MITTHKKHPNDNAKTKVKENHKKEKNKKETEKEGGSQA